MGLHIREIADDDVAAVIALWQACDLTRPRNDPHDDVALARTTSSSTIFVATATAAPGASDGDAGPGGENVVGTVMVGCDGHRGWMYYLAVAPDARGRGFGRDLVVAAEAWLATQGAGKVQLMVRGTNTATIGFYERLGYTDQDCVVLGRRFS